MNRPEINDLLKNVPSWNDPGHDAAKRCFIGAMSGRQYGYDALASAWEWFLVGWYEDTI